jgi:hypothetical protein
MENVKTIAEWMSDQGVGLEEMVKRSGLERKIMQTIIQGHYTPSPQQRQRLAAALGLDPVQVAWGHREQVQHMYGHGPQFGRSP